MDVLADLAERYDHVLVDSPPAVTYSDARTIAASCDLTLLVVRPELANARMFELAREGLTNVGANISGVVINHGMGGHQVIAPLALEMKQAARVEKSTPEDLHAKSLAAPLAGALSFSLSRYPGRGSG